jgi:hypothetical protein
MGSIYEQAIAAVAAATSPDDGIGFLRPTPTRSLYLSRSVDMFPFGEHSGVQARRVHDFRMKSTADPLDLRAWTFQEKILPRRVLTYSSGLTFECRTLSYCECGSGLRSDPLLDNKLGDDVLSNWTVTDRDVLESIGYGASVPALAKAEIYTSWYFRVVQQYSRRKLARESDRLPAVSAVASKFHQALGGDVYVAGLWKSDIIRGLFWERAPDDIQDSQSSMQLNVYYWGLPAKDLAQPALSTQFSTQPTQTYLAPSWSWASIRRPVNFTGLHLELTTQNVMRKYIRAHGSACFSMRGNDFGRVTGGFLRLSGPTTKAQISIDTHGDSGTTLSITSVDAKGGRVVWENPFGSLDTVLKAQPLPGSKDQVTLVRATENETWEFPVIGSVTLVWMSTYPTSGSEPGRDFYLVLARITATQEVYQRLGILREGIYAHSKTFAERASFKGADVMVI